LKILNNQTIQLNIFGHFDFIFDEYEDHICDEFVDMPGIQQPDKFGVGRLVHEWWLLPAASHSTSLAQAEGDKF
jgi:hypothetical protein